MTSNFLKYWAPFYLYAGLIFYVSGIPKPLPDAGIPFLDKFLHISEFVVFAVLASRAFRNSSKKTLVQNFKVWAILASIIYGMSDEFHQYFISDRQCSLSDLLADGIGGTLGAFIYGRYYPV